MFFVGKYEQIFNFNSKDIDVLQDQFTDYQLLPADYFPNDVSGSRQGHPRLDAVWTFLSKVRHADGQFWFPLLSRVAENVILINAEEERIFSMVRKSKTDFRPTLDSRTTLSSLLMTKLALPEGNVLKFELSTQDMLAKAKKATVAYNREHLR